MIDNKSLMIGNYIYTSVKLESGVYVTCDIVKFQVSEINKYGVTHGIVDQREEYFFKWEQIEPVPLSMELIESMGFDFVGGNTYQKDAIEIFRYEYDNSFYQSETQLQVKYVHELQNLYKVTTGKDLRLSENNKIITLKQARAKVYKESKIK